MLKLTESPYRKAYREFCRILQTDPTLKSVGCQFSLWQGEKGETHEPTLNQLPWIRVTPIEASSSRGGEGFHEVRFPLELDVAVAGTNLNDYLDLCYAIVLAVLPIDTTRRNEVDRMKTNASFQLELTRPGFNVSMPEGEGKMLQGSMQFDLLIHLITR